MKHQLCALLRSISDSADREMKELEGRLQELNEVDVSDHMKHAKDLDTAEYRFALVREFRRGVAVVANAVASEILGEQMSPESEDMANVQVGQWAPGWAPATESRYVQRDGA